MPEKGNVWNPKWRWITAALLALMMLVIYRFSAQTGGDSSELSRQITAFLLKMLHSEYDNLPWFDRLDVFYAWHTFVRKCAHFMEYALMGFLLRLFWQTFAVRGRWLISLAISAAFACTDEIHQLFIRGRSGSATDVLIDSCGALFGILLSSMLVFFIYKCKKKSAS